MGSGIMDSAMSGTAPGMGSDTGSASGADTGSGRHPAQGASIGLDVGSAFVKVAILDRDQALCWHHVEPSEPWLQPQLERLVQRLRDLGLDERTPMVATGYGRRLVPGQARPLTEISCHAAGAWLMLKQPRLFCCVSEQVDRYAKFIGQVAGPARANGITIVDIGGQDSKVIVLGQDGKAIRFAMNDKCSAGTGRFLESTASRLQLSLDQMMAICNEACAVQAPESGRQTERGSADSGPDAAQHGPNHHPPRIPRGERRLTISSTCTVFAESEIIGLIARGTPIPAIVCALHEALARRVAALVRSVGPRQPYLLSGGVARNAALAGLLGAELGEPVLALPLPQLVGALGAASLAAGSAAQAP